MMEVKTLCEKCKGVIGGKVKDFSSGEYPCSCNRINPMVDLTLTELYNWIKKSFNKGEHWKNGREVKNANS